MEAEYNELVSAFKELQTEYEKIGWFNVTTYARTCHALDWAEKNQSKMVELIRAGEEIQDWQKHQGKED